MNLYKKILKPILFKLDPEYVHNKFTRIGVFFGNYLFLKKVIRSLFYFENKKRLEQNLFGIYFKNPIGLSAGFDYNIQLNKILGDIGFAFMSGGTVTYNFYEGNKRPRLARLPKSKSLLVNKGFKSLGIKKVLDNVSFTSRNYAKVGISIGATNSPIVCDPEAQVKDILKSFKYLMQNGKKDNFSYFELNISCPNVVGSGVLSDPKILDTLLFEIRKIIGLKILFVKFQAEIEWNEARELVKIMINHNVDAIIVANLLKKKTNYDFDNEEIQKVIDNNWKGNFSGKPVEKFSNDLIGKIYKEFGDKIKIIGAGGIFSADDAYLKIKLGASLVQLITGMIFEGPQLIGKINKDLVKLLEKDGFENINEAVGSFWNDKNNKHEINI